MSRKTLFVTILVLLVSVALVAQQTVERIDLNVIHKLKTAEEGGGRGGGGGRGAGGAARGLPPVMETLYNLTDRYGPRLTNSPQFRAAGEWAVAQLKDWGLSNVHLENLRQLRHRATMRRPAVDAAAGEPRFPVGR